MSQITKTINDLLKEKNALEKTINDLILNFSEDNPSCDIDIKFSSREIEHHKQLSSKSFTKVTITVTV